MWRGSLGVTKCSIANWECDRGQPEFRYMPAVIRFLGYNSLPTARTIPERLVRGRTSLGLSQSQAARRMEIDPGTLSSWELGQSEPKGDLAVLAERFLREAEEDDSKSFNLQKPAAG